MDGTTDVSEQTTENSGGEELETAQVAEVETPVVDEPAVAEVASTEPEEFDGASLMEQYLSDPSKGYKTLKYGDVIDGVIPEPAGGAHNDSKAAAEYVKAAIIRHRDELKTLSAAELVEQRYQKFRVMTRMQK